MGVKHSQMSIQIKTSRGLEIIFGAALSQSVWSFDLKADAESGGDMKLVS